MVPVVLVGIVFCHSLIKKLPQRLFFTTLSNLKCFFSSCHWCLLLFCSLLLTKSTNIILEWTILSIAPLSLIVLSFKPWTSTMVHLSNILFSIPLNHFFADLAKCIIFDAEMYLRWYFSCNNFKSLLRIKKTKRYCNCFMLFYSSWSEVPSCGTSYELMFDKFFLKHKVTCPPTFDSTVKVRYNVSACLPLGKQPSLLGCKIRLTIWLRVCTNDRRWFQLFIL